MAETATILIPDISGYTDFVTRTEVEHGAFILNNLLEVIVQMVPSDFVVSEIEGDAVLLYKKGNPPTKKELVEQCVKIFTAFHSMIRNMAGAPLCQCKACAGLTDLTLKFVVHFGTIAEINVSRFTKASGVDMVIAHRLLKNNIPEHEYMLTTDSYLKNIPDGSDANDLDWMEAREEYPSIGVVEYSFASFAAIKNALPPVEDKRTTAASVDENGIISADIEIGAPYIEVEQILVDMKRRMEYVEGMKGYEGNDSLALGMKSIIVFDDRKEEIEAQHIEVKDDEIIFEEFASSPEKNYFAVCRYDIKVEGKESCHFTLSVFPQPGYSFSHPMIHAIAKRNENLCDKLKAYCESYWEKESKEISAKRKEQTSSSA